MLFPFSCTPLHSRHKLFYHNQRLISSHKPQFHARNRLEFLSTYARQIMHFAQTAAKKPENPLYNAVFRHFVIFLSRLYYYNIYAKLTPTAAPLKWSLFPLSFCPTRPRVPCALLAHRSLLFRRVSPHKLVKRFRRRFRPQPHHNAHVPRSHRVAAVRVTAGKRGKLRHKRHSHHHRPHPNRR